MPLTPDTLFGRVCTTRYMSPEQAQGQPVDPRSDIFSFGAVLHEMITGRVAFAGDSFLDIASAVIRETQKPLSDAGRQVPRELERIVARCLRKDPDRRFQSAADLKVALEELREETESGERSPAVPAPRRRWRTVLLAVALAAGWQRRRFGGLCRVNAFRPRESPSRSCRSPAILGTKLCRRSRLRYAGRLRDRRHRQQQRRSRARHRHGRAHFSDQQRRRPARTALVAGWQVGGLSQA